MSAARWARGPADGPADAGTGRSPRRWTRAPRSLPTWLWLAISCLVGLTVAVVLLHLLGAARSIPG